RAPFPRRPVPVRFRQSTLNAHRRCRRTPVQLRFHSRFASARFLSAQLLLAQYPPDSSAKTLLCRLLPNNQEYRVVVNYPAAVHPPAGSPPAWSPPAGMCSRTESGLHKVGTIHSSTTPPRGGSYNIPEVRVYVCSMTVDEGFNGTAERVRVPVAAAGQIAGTLWLPDGAISGAVTIHPATAVRERLYAGFATYLTEHGFAVLTYDYRGTGASG